MGFPLAAISAGASLLGALRGGKKQAAGGAAAPPESPPMKSLYDLRGILGYGDTYPQTPNGMPMPPDMNEIRARKKKKGASLSPILRAILGLGPDVEE